MDKISRHLVVGALAVWLTSLGAQPAYPGKPIRLIVPTPAGGPSDAAARALAKGLTASLGQEVLVENRPGGNTGIGAGAVLNAAADGYTLLFALASNAGLPPQQGVTLQVHRRVHAGRHDWRHTQCLVVPASLPAKSLANSSHTRKPIRSH